MAFSTPGSSAGRRSLAEARRYVAEHLQDHAADLRVPIDAHRLEQRAQRQPLRGGRGEHHAAPHASIRIIEPARA